MSRQMVDTLVHALLYEGYMLYPYRPSVKNRQRWTFGGLYPRSWSDANDGSDAWIMQTECLIQGDMAALAVSIRFLHLIDRTIGQLASPLSDWPRDTEPAFTSVPFLELEGKRLQPWQEAQEREVDLGNLRVDQLLQRPSIKTFDFPYRREFEPVTTGNSQIVGVIAREQQSIAGEVIISALEVGHNCYRVKIAIANVTSLALAANRDEALMRSFVSTNTVLESTKGEFISLTDPPEQHRTQAAACRNVGTWPIMVGDESARNRMLSSPIILSDYPQIAPESPGDLFDAGEIDEILTLRILTLTDEEKRAAAAIDDRVQKLLMRTEALARDQMQRLHGVVRETQTAAGGRNHE